MPEGKREIRFAREIFGCAERERCAGRGKFGIRLSEFGIALRGEKLDCVGAAERTANGRGRFFCQRE